MSKQAWISNGVITYDDGRLSVRYRPRCPYCGYVPVNLECSSSALEGLRASRSTTCSQCRKWFDIIISRG